MFPVAFRYRADGVLMMEIFTDTITVYNHLPDDRYQRTVVKGVMVTGKTVKTVTADGKVNLAATVNITIPESAVCERKYLPKHEFRKLSDAENYWTLDDAGNLDVIVRGEVAVEITDEYRIKHLRADYDCVTVAEVSDNRNKPRLKHIKVVCK
nr:MAG TPA: hypothetical protein [Caudoviricetes sp.]